ncbi:MAG: metallophosphoesterase family protein [Patescibacteria group bacterium]
MLIAIISDIHDNLANLKTCLSYCEENEVSKLICCGDITNLDTVKNLAKNFLGEIFIVSGNADLYEEKDLSKFSNINYYGEIAVNEIAGVNIGFCHEPDKIRKVKELAPFKLDFIFYGHTHKPWLEKDDGLIIANPGTLAGVFNAATFAILETSNKNLELKIVADL